MPRGIYQHKPHSEETKRKISIARKGYKCTEETKKKMGMAQKKRFINSENHPQWKGGISKDRKYKNKRQVEYLHRIGFCKKYNSDNNISYTKEYIKMATLKRRILEKNNGKLLLQTIQSVYEDNIKRFGTLTCYLCLKPIEFGEDSLEHKIPLSRGGNNTKDNLDIAHKNCNSSKHNKTEEEYRNQKKEVLSNV